MRAIIPLLALLLSGCFLDTGPFYKDPANNREGPNPPTTLYEPKEGMLVVRVGRPDVLTNTGHQHEYIIQNGSGENWTLYTHSEFKVGDFVEVTKQRPWP